jgi:hypothetical protein
MKTDVAGGTAPQPTAALDKERAIDEDGEKARGGERGGGEGRWRRGGSGSWEEEGIGHGEEAGDWGVGLREAIGAGG